MSVRFEVREVRLIGMQSEWRWGFRRGVNVIVGPVGTGKTTLLNLVRFGLGGSWTPTKKAKESAHSVRLTLSIAGTEVTTQRAFGSGQATVEVAGAEPQVLPLKRRRGRDDRTLSDLLLELSGLPRVRVPTSRSKPGKQLTTISFADVMTHLYLEQEEIDRSTARSEDKILGPKRAYVFELLYGLIDEQTASLTRQAGERDDERKRLGRERKLLEAWARQYRVALSETFTADRATASVRELDLRVQELEQVIADRDAEVIPLRQELERVEKQLNDADRLLDRQVQELDRLRGVQAQLELDLERMTRGEEAVARFQAFEYAICPRCLQDLSIDHPASCCRLCGQEDAQAPSVVAIESERIRRTEQLNETIELTDELAARTEDLQAQRKQFQAAHDAAANQLALQTPATRQLLEQRTVLLVERASALREAQLAHDLPRPEFLLDELDRQLAQIAVDRKRIADESRQHETRLTRRRQDLSVLSTIFAEILAVLDLPWFEGHAVIDPGDYLPRVDEQTLSELSSGGMKATVNLAYYLSNLVFALREPSALMPRFLMIDGLRKDFGAGAKDLARADTIYRFLLTQQDAIPGPPLRPFQMLVVDNDLPAGVARRVHVIELDYESPLISEESAA